MTPFPAVDPTPLPARVWLFKLLHSVTLALHLGAVDLLLGGLMIGLAMHIAGRWRRSPEMLNVSGMLAHRLPTEFYGASPRGVQLNLGDLTLVTRWHFFLAGALPGAAVALLLLALKSDLGAGERSLPRRSGGAISALGLVAEGVLGVRRSFISGWRPAQRFFESARLAG